MNDNSSTEHNNSDDSFPDEQSGNESFQLEKLEKYPADLPYDASADAASADESEPVSLSPTLVATIKEDLERSRIQRSRHDTLEDSIHRLRDQLQGDGDDASLSEESEVSDAQAEREASSGEDDVRNNPVFAEKPVMLPSAEEPLPLVDTPLDLDLNELDRIQPSTTQESNSTEGTTMPDVPELEQLPSSRRLIYGLVGVLLLAVLGGGAWWFTSHSGSQNSGAQPSTASHSPTEGANGEAEARMKKTQEDHGSTPSAHETATDVHESTTSTHADNQAGTHVERKESQPVAHAPVTESKPDNHATAANQSPASSHVNGKQEPTGHASNTAAQHSATSPSTNTAVDKSHVPSTTASKQADTKDHSAKSTPSVATHDAPSKALTVKKQESTTAVKKEQKSPATNSMATKNNERTPTTQKSIAENIQPSTQKDATSNSNSPQANSKQPKQPTSSTKNIASASPQSGQSSDKAGAAGSQKNPAPDTKQSTAYEPKMIAKPVVRNVPTSAKGVFTVQVYSTPNHEDADDWMRRLRTKKVEGGFVSKQNVRGTTYYRVRFGQYATRQEAESAAMSSGFQSSWVDRVK